MDNDALHDSILKRLEQLDEQLQALNTRVSRLEGLLNVRASEVKPKPQPSHPIQSIRPTDQYQKPAQPAPPPIPAEALLNRIAPRTEPNPEDN